MGTETKALVLILRLTVLLVVDIVLYCGLCNFLTASVVANFELWELLDHEFFA
jgi:hypothetical protein